MQDIGIGLVACIVHKDINTCYASFHSHHLLSLSCGQQGSYQKVVLQTAFQDRRTQQFTMSQKRYYTVIVVCFISTVGNFAVVKSESLIANERIITDYQDVVNGVPIDYRYNESAFLSSGHGLPSVPGCPKSDEGYPWVYFGLPPKCYLVRQQIWADNFS